MKRNAILLLLLGIFMVGCCRLPVCTKTVYLYRDSDVNGGRPCAVDIIYPKDKAEFDKIVTEIGPGKWFTSDLYDKVHKDKAWLDTDVTAKTLVNKAADDPYMVIFAEFTKADPNPPRGRESYLSYFKEKQPKGKKTEYIGVHNGSLERLTSAPSGARR